jgi:hypothetical protein
MARCTIAWQILELTLNMAIHTGDLLVGTIQLETCCGVIKPDQTVQAVMAARTSIPKFSQMGCDKF